MTDPIMIACPACTALNRVPAQRLGEGPTCGKCHAALFAGKPVAVDDASFERIVLKSGVPVVVDMGPAELQHDPAGEVLPADLDGDGGVGIADVLVLLASWGQCTSACCLSDLDFDGKTAESDLLALLEAWDP